MNDPDEVRKMEVPEQIEKRKGAIESLIAPRVPNASHAEYEAKWPGCCYCGECGNTLIRAAVLCAVCHAGERLHAVVRLTDETLREVIEYYDAVLEPHRAEIVGDPEWDFVMTAHEYQVLRAAALVGAVVRRNLSSESLVEWASHWVPENNRARFAEALASELRRQSVLSQVSGNAEPKSLLRPAATPPPHDPTRPLTVNKPHADRKNPEEFGQ